MNHKSIIAQRLSTIPLSLYIHFPWCLSKCPYCDFNSYPLSNKEFVPAYVDKLLMDMKIEASKYRGSKLKSIYFGGGTPSLLPPSLVAVIINEAKKYFSGVSAIEITLEANPGTIDINICEELREAGINRISIGAQSFADAQLEKIKRTRTHNVEQAMKAIEAVKIAGFTNFNIDLMFGLPEQTLEDAVNDLAIALSFEPPHLSWYQLTVDSKFTIETGIADSALPCNEKLWEIQQIGKEFLAKKGWNQYEVSAYCRFSEARCQHNMNYWQYGDYLGIGAGAHGKITFGDYVVKRSSKVSEPHKYIDTHDFIEMEERITSNKLPLEFMLNALRLYQPISYELFQKRTGFTINVITKQLQDAQLLGLLELRDDSIITTDRGKDFLNDLLELFV